MTLSNAEVATPAVLFESIRSRAGRVQSVAALCTQVARGHGDENLADTLELVSEQIELVLAELRRLQDASLATTYPELTRAA